MSHIGPLVSDPGRTVHVARLAAGGKASELASASLWYGHGCVPFFAGVYF